MKQVKCPNCGSPDIIKDNYDCSFCGSNFDGKNYITYFNERGEATHRRELSFLHSEARQMINQSISRMKVSALSGVFDTAGNLLDGILQAKQRFQ